MNAPVAVVRGEPLQAPPAGLYIPPDALEVFLESFSGPLDLLLYLIRRDDLDILDIPIAQVTEQYIAYIERMDGLRMELAAEYLLMAAYLAEIKSRMLLPRPAVSLDEEDDLRADLVRRLLEYERFRQAALHLDRLPRMERDRFSAGAGHNRLCVRRRYPEIRLDEVLAALRDVLLRGERSGHHPIRKEPLSVRERMVEILRRLGEAEVLAFSEMFRRTEGRRGAVVALLALLELAREGLVELVQDEGGVRARAGWRVA